MGAPEGEFSDNTNRGFGLQDELQRWTIEAPEGRTHPEYPCELRFHWKGRGI
jgi:hypothetical protein